MTTGYWLAVALGGAIGSLGRAGISVWLPSVGAFPLPTLAVNLLGSLAIGLMWAALARIDASALWGAFVITGVLGGFTTFSSFSLEILQLFEQGAWQTALLYAALSLVTCVLGAGLGVGLIKLVA